MYGDDDEDITTCGDDCANPYHEHVATPGEADTDPLGRPFASLDDPRVRSKDA